MLHRMGSCTVPAASFRRVHCTAQTECYRSVPNEEVALHRADDLHAAVCSSVQVQPCDLQDCFSYLKPYLCRVLEAPARARREKQDISTAQLRRIGLRELQRLWLEPPVGSPRARARSQLQLPLGTPRARMHARSYAQNVRSPAGTWSSSPSSRGARSRLTRPSARPRSCRAKTKQERSVSCMGPLPPVWLRLDV